MEDNELQWIEAAQKYGIKVPEPTINKVSEYSGKFITRVSTQVHREAAENAKREGISLNQYVNNALITMNSCESSQDFIKRFIDKLSIKPDIDRAKKKVLSTGMRYGIKREDDMFILVTH